jgi:hypothetical protein
MCKVLGCKPRSINALDSCIIYLLGMGFQAELFVRRRRRLGSAVDPALRCDSKVLC